MNTNNVRYMFFAACVGASVAMTSAATPPTTQPLTPAQTESLAIRTHLPKEFFQVGDILKVPGTYTDETKKADALRKAQPILQNEIKEFDRLAEIDPPFVAMRESEHRSIAVTLAALGDPASMASIQSAIASKDETTSLAGQADLMKVKWSLAHKDPKLQQAIADDVEKLDRQHPQERRVDDTVVILCLRGGDAGVEERPAGGGPWHDQQAIGPAADDRQVL